MEEVNMQQSLSTHLDVWVVGHCGPIQEMWEKLTISSQDQTYMGSFVLRPPSMNVASLDFTQSLLISVAVPADSKLISHSMPVHILYMAKHSAALPAF